MYTAKPSAPKLLLSVALLTLAAVSVPMHGQDRPAVRIGQKVIAGVPDDWSHHHVGFPNPGTMDEAIHNGTYEQWVKIVNEPRYLMQQLKKGLPVQGFAAQDVNIRNAQRAWARGSHWTPYVPPERKRTRSAIKKDWSMSLAGAGTGTVGADQYPAKFSFATDTGDASCSDFVVYNTGVAGTATQPTIIAYNNIYPGCPGYTTGASPGPPVYFQYNTSFAQASTTADASTITTSPVFTGWESTTSPNIAFIEDAGTAAASLVLLKFASNPALVQMNVITGGSPNNVTPANFHACAAPCMTRIPFSGGNSDLRSSPYYDYTDDVIYVGDTATATADPEFHKFIHIYNNTPTVPPSECTATGTGCSSTTAFPVSIGHGGGASLTSPVLDLVSGNVFAGETDGRANMVSSTTGTVTTRTVSSGTGFFDAPVVDSAPATPVAYFFGYGGTDEDVWQLSTTTLATNVTQTLPAGSAMVDYYDGAFDNLHYAISGGAAGHMYVCGGTTTPNLYQITFPFTAGSTVTAATPTLNTAAGACSPITEFLASKDNTNLTGDINNAVATIPIGSGTGTATGDYIQIDNEIMHITGGAGTSSLTVTRAQLGTAAAAHTNETDVQDIQDFIFLSVTAGGRNQGSPACTGACLYNYNVTTGAAPTAPVAGIAETGGTSGIVIDNSSTTTGYSNIYFSTRGTATCAGNGTVGSGTHGCAIQASQSAP